MKIMILANSSRGLYNFRNEVVLKLLKEYEVVISLPDDECVKELEEEGCKVIYTPINRRGMNPVEDLKTYKAYITAIKREKPDLVLTYTIKPNIYGGFACRMKGIPYMTTITGLGSTFQNDGLVKKVIILMYRTALKKAQCVFFQNNENREIFKNNNIIGKDAITVKGSGVNLKEHIYQEYPSDEKIRLLFVGRIMKEKGIEELLEVAKKMQQDNLEFGILGSYDEDYEDMLHEYEKNRYIVLHGYSKNVKPYYKECSALLLPTYHEGMSNVLMEASASGRPVLASNIWGCKEIFEDGITGYGFEPQNVESLEDAVRKFLMLSCEQRKEMGKKARTKMEQEFDREKVADEYMKMIHQCINKGEKL